jgi:hypothetical protein
MPYDLCNEIRVALNYDAKRSLNGLDEFIESLPLHLQMSITMEIHKVTFN